MLIRAEATDMLDEADPTQRATAVHEAGHVVIGLALGFPCGGVTIKRTKVELGHAAIGNPLDGWRRGDGPRRELAEEIAIGLYAGAEAERLILNSQLCGDGDDVGLARSFLAKYVGARSSKHIEKALEREEERLRGLTRELVGEHRAKILTVANALLARGSLSGNDIDALLRPTTSPSSSGR